MKTITFRCFRNNTGRITISHTQNYSPGTTKHVVLKIILSVLFELQDGLEPSDNVCYHQTTQNRPSICLK